jgi:hypothetical protein
MTTASGGFLDTYGSSNAGAGARYAVTTAYEGAHDAGRARRGDELTYVPRWIRSRAKAIKRLAVGTSMLLPRCASSSLIQAPSMLPSTAC